MAAPDYYPGVSYIRARSYGEPRARTPLIVMHATDNTASAIDEARYASVRTDGTSTHFFVDESSVYQVVPLPDIAYGCFWHGNQISVQIELCGLSNHITDATMRRAAPIVKQLCDWYGIPVRKLTPAEVRAAYYTGDEAGICGHADVTVAFPEDGGDHTDPGSMFPWDTFLSYVGGDMALIDDPDFSAEAWRIKSLLDLSDKVESGKVQGEAVPLVVAFKEVLSKVDVLVSTVDGIKAALAALPAASAHDIAAEIIAQLSGKPPATG